MNTVYQYSLQLLVLVVKLNDQLLLERMKVFADIDTINAMKKKLWGMSNNGKGNDGRDYDEEMKE